MEISFGESNMLTARIREMVCFGSCVVVACAAVVGAGWASGSDGLPGNPANADLVSSIRAQAWGPCIETTNNCTGNRPPEDACSATDGVCDHPEAPCGRCTGDKHHSCASQKQVECEESTTECCEVMTDCTQTTAGCECMASSSSHWIGIRITCS